VRRDDERLADILEAAEKITIRAAKGRAAFDGDDILWDVAVIDVPQLASQVLAIQSGDAAN